MKYYTLRVCEDVISRYIEKGAECTTIEEGILGLGQVVLHGLDGYKVAVITEVAINSWSSGHKIRFYNSMPAKYQKLIDKL
jgi:hypothetical protein